ncbi:MAG: hypothetical protein WB586_00970 [Chthoniobacterales bacterium]
MPKRLAITISGAVSLGSYEAGVLFETIEALRQHNINRETTDSEKILIDVITGASAGGMTAAIATQKPLYDASALAGERNNAFYLPWVFFVLDRFFRSFRATSRFSTGTQGSATLHPGLSSHAPLAAMPPEPASLTNLSKDL